MSNSIRDQVLVKVRDVIAAQPGLSASVSVRGARDKATLPVRVLVAYENDDANEAVVLNFLERDLVVLAQVDVQVEDAPASVGNNAMRWLDQQVVLVEKAVQGAIQTTPELGIAGVRRCSLLGVRALDPTPENTVGAQVRLAVKYWHDALDPTAYTGSY